MDADNYFYDKPDPFRVSYYGSRHLAIQIEAKQRECWKNAVLSVLVLDNLYRESIYCEGFVLRPGLPIPIEHGWVLYGDTILDPTLVLLDNATVRDNFYFSASTYGREELESFVWELGEDESLMLPLFLYRGGKTALASHGEAHNRVWRYLFRDNPEAAKIMHRPEKAVKKTL